jgi:hypothetical protein
VDEQQASGLMEAALTAVAPEADLKGADQTDLQSRMDLDSIDIEEFFAELEPGASTGAAAVLWAQPTRRPRRRATARAGARADAARRRW